MGQRDSSLSQSLEDVMGKVATAQQCVLLHLSLGKSLHYGKVEKFIPSWVEFGSLS